MKKISIIAAAIALCSCSATKTTDAAVDLNGEWDIVTVDGITLQPISLKTHSVSSEELARAVSSISELIAAQPKPAETTQLSDSQDTAEVDQPAAYHS